MIRIDEIYQNVFVEAVRNRPEMSVHWFDPFGSTNFFDLMCQPKIYGRAKRIVFWDQEPLYKDNAIKFFDQFCEVYRPPREPEFHTTLTLVTSEIKSEDLSLIQQRYAFERTNHYFFHGWAALDWYRGYNHSYLGVPWLDRNFIYDWICPNNIVGGHRKHRLLFLDRLIKHDLLDNGLMSFPAVCPYEKKSVRDLMHDSGLSLPDSINLPLIIDQDRDHSANSHAITFWPQSMQSFCHVVTETVYDSCRIHLTEKTFKPIVLQQPFLLLSARNSLRYLKGYGFKTFHDLWDESYDDLSDDLRLDAVVRICEQISGWSGKTKKNAQSHIWPILKHNHDWFYQDFQNVLWQELTDMVNQWE